MAVLLPLRHGAAALDVSDHARMWAAAVALDREHALRDFSTHQCVGNVSLFMDDLCAAVMRESSSGARPPCDSGSNSKSGLNRPLNKLATKKDLQVTIR